MFTSFFHRCFLAVVAFFAMAVPLWAQGAKDAAAEPEQQVWVVSYSIIILFLVLSLMILLRRTKRDDSAFSYDELQAQKEEEMKKIKGGH